jgi:hypothetical protein
MLLSIISLVSLATGWRTSIWLGWRLSTGFTATVRPCIWLCDAHLLDRCRIRRIDESWIDLRQLVVRRRMGNGDEKEGLYDPPHYSVVHS